jgi:hypothetical protein
MPVKCRLACRGLGRPRAVLVGVVIRARRLVVVELLPPELSVQFTVYQHLPINLGPDRIRLEPKVGLDLVCN